MKFKVDCRHEYILDESGSIYAISLPEIRESYVQIYQAAVLLYESSLDSLERAVVNLDYLIAEIKQTFKIKLIAKY
jgi:hypothetical protein